MRYSVRLAIIILRGVSKTLFVVWLTMTILFFSVRLLPGDIISGQFAGTGVADDVQNNLREALGLNLPILEQYRLYFSDWIRGEWGIARSTGEFVWQAVTRSLTITLVITSSGIVLATVIGIFWGIMLAYTSHKWFEQILKMLLDIFLATPIFWSVTLLVFILAIPVTSHVDGILVAVFLMMLHIGASIAQLIYRAIQQQLSALYVQTAFSKGLRKRYVYFRHILPNVSLIYIPFIASQVSLLIGGTVIIESVLLLPGLGTLLLNATLHRDYLLLQGAVTVVILLVSFVNVLRDVLLIALNPRLRGIS